jgi:hypothetical protein
LSSTLIERSEKLKMFQRGVILPHEFPSEGVHYHLDIIFICASLKLRDQTFDDTKEEKPNLLLNEGAATFKPVKIVCELTLVLPETA